MDPNENTLAEIYANIRDKALEEAANAVPDPLGFDAEYVRGCIRALKNATPQVAATTGEAAVAGLIDNVAMPSEPRMDQPAESASTKEKE